MIISNNFHIKNYLPFKIFTTFTTLKKIVYILILFIGISTTSFSQARPLVSDANTAAKLVNFYPNPATSNITFEFVKGYENQYSLDVFNFMGKKVYSVKKIPQRISIILDEFYRGIYIFQLRNKNGVIVQSGKFQVVK